MDKQAVFKAYTEHFWLTNKDPESIKELCEICGIEPLEFKVAFQSISGLRSALLGSVLETAKESVQKAAGEHEYSKREECLALFFSLIEHFTPYKTYLKARYSLKEPKLFVEDWRNFNQQFVGITKDYLEDERLLWLRDKIPTKLSAEMNALLIGWNYVLRVFLADETEDNTQTDAAIEKSIHLYFDFASTNQLEQLLDFGKFVFSTKVSF